MHQIDNLDQESRSDHGSDGLGLISRLRDWKQHEKELHRDHRGVMQAKPARTAQWIKAGAEEKIHEAKGTT